MFNVYHVPDMLSNKSRHGFGLHGVHGLKDKQRNVDSYDRDHEKEIQGTTRGCNRRILLIREAVSGEMILELTAEV